MKAIIQLVLRRLQSLIRARGITGAVLYLGRNMFSLTTQLRRALLDISYDRRMGVQTTGQISAADLEIDQSKIDGVGVGVISGSAYAPSPAWALPAVLQDLKIRYKEYNFIDLGSGMGRVVLIAAQLPFSKVIGVELSQKLHEIAKDNLARISGRQKAGSVELLLQDASEYSPPPGNCVIYLANPFRENVMRTVLDNLNRWLETQPGEMYLVYFVPVLAALLDTMPFLTKVKSDRHYVIYRAQPARIEA